MIHLDTPIEGIAPNQVVEIDGELYITPSMWGYRVKVVYDGNEYGAIEI